MLARATPLALSSRSPGARCAHDRPPPAARSPDPRTADPRSRRQSGTRRRHLLTSNVGQNYPYTSEKESERAAVIARLLNDRADLGAKLTAETTPLTGDDDQWWVWKCPTTGC